MTENKFKEGTAIKAENMEYEIIGKPNFPHNNVILCENQHGEKKYVDMAYLREVGEIKK